MLGLAMPGAMLGGAMLWPVLGAVLGAVVCLCDGLDLFHWMYGGELSNPFASVAFFVFLFDLLIWEAFVNECLYRPGRRINGPLILPVGLFWIPSLWATIIVFHEALGLGEEAVDRVGPRRVLKTAYYLFVGAVLGYLLGRWPLVFVGGMWGATLGASWGGVLAFDIHLCSSLFACVFGSILTLFFVFILHNIFILNDIAESSSYSGYPVAFTIMLAAPIVFGALFVAVLTIHSTWYCVSESSFSKCWGLGRRDFTDAEEAQERAIEDGSAVLREWPDHAGGEREWPGARIAPAHLPLSLVRADRASPLPVRAPRSCDNECTTDERAPHARLTKAQSERVSFI
jgi:hypothetical protein